MKITKQNPEKKYPYLAVYTGGAKFIDDAYGIDEVFVISIQTRPNQDSVKYAQLLNGSREGYVTTKEEDYTPLPAGTKITITQE